MKVAVVGWHIHSEAAECQNCDKSATVVVQGEDGYTVFNLCNECLKKHKVTSDKIEEIFRNLGL